MERRTETGIKGRVRLFNTRYTRARFSHLRQVCHLTSYIGTNRVGHMVQLSQARKFYSHVASIECTSVVIKGGCPTTLSRYMKSESFIERPRQYRPPKMSRRRNVFSGLSQNGGAEPY